MNNEEEEKYPPPPLCRRRNCGCIRRFPRKQRFRVTRDALEKIVSFYSKTNVPPEIVHLIHNHFVIMDQSMKLRDSVAAIKAMRVRYFVEDDFYGHHGIFFRTDTLLHKQEYTMHIERHVSLQRSVYRKRLLEDRALYQKYREVIRSDKIVDAYRNLITWIFEQMAEGLYIHSIDQFMTPQNYHTIINDQFDQIYERESTQLIFDKDMNMVNIGIGDYLV